MSARTLCMLWLLAAAWATPTIAVAADSSTAEILQRLEALERTQAEQAQALRERDARIAELEARLAEVSGLPSAPSGDVPETRLSSRAARASPFP